MTMPGPQAQRTDLLTPEVPNGPPPGQGQPNGQPVQVPTGLPYGEAGQLAAAQQAVPLAKGAPAPGPAGGLDIARAMEAAKQMQPPSNGGLGRPTERPNEPITAGLQPGAPSQRQVGNLSAMIDHIAKATNSAALSQLAARAAAAGQ